MSDVNPKFHLFSSMMSGAVVSFTLFPVELIKKSLVANMYDREFNFRENVRKLNLIRGANIFALNIIPTTTIQLFTNDMISPYIRNDASLSLKLLGSAFCGFQGAICATFIENFVTQLVKKDISSFQALKNLFEIGWLRPWASFSLIATRDAIFTICLLCINPEVRNYMQKNYSGKYGLEMLASFSVGFIGTILSHPFDTVATRVQTENTPQKIPAVVKEIFQSHGYKGFFKALWCRVILFNCFTNMIPFVKKFIDKQAGKKEII